MYTQSRAFTFAASTRLTQPDTAHPLSHSAVRSSPASASTSTHADLSCHAKAFCAARFASFS